MTTRAAILLPIAALLTSASAPPRELCAKPGRTAAGYCTMIFFEFDSAEVPASGWPILDRVVAEVEDNEGARVMVAGHTDRTVSAEYALGLGQRMASSVRDHLVQHGVKPGTIVVESYGSTQPRVRAAEGKREPGNRRVEIWVLE